VKRFALSLVLVGGLLLGMTACDESTNVQVAIQQNFGDSAALQQKAVRVAKCESGLDADAVSPGGANHGLFQINNVHKAAVQRMGYSWSQIYDPYVNAKVARYIYNSAGGSWSPWGCRNA